MKEAVIMQFNSSLCYLSESMCNLDVNTTLKVTNKSNNAPITGKKIISELQIPVSLKEKPPPCKIFAKIRPQDRSSSRKKQSEKTNKLVSSDSKKPIKYRKKDIKKLKAVKKQTFKVQLRNKSEKHSPQTKPQLINNPSKPLKLSPEPKVLSSNIKAIIHSTLKKEHIKKLKTERAKKGLEEMNQIKKYELSQQNMQIRKENKKFKKIKFKPKYH